MDNPTELEIRVALAIGRVITRGPVEPKKGWIEAARAAIKEISNARSLPEDDPPSGPQGQS